MIIDFDNLDIKAEFLHYNTSALTYDPTGLFREQTVESLELHNLHGESVRDVRGLFRKSKALKKIVFNNVSLDSVEIARNMFHLCPDLVSIDIIGKKPLLPNCSDIRAMFNRTSVKEINLYDFIGTHECCRYDYLFVNNSSLERLNLENFVIKPAEFSIESYSEDSNTMFSYTSCNVKIKLPNDAFTRRKVINDLTANGWNMDQIVNNCTLKGMDITDKQIKEWR